MRRTVFEKPNGEAARFAAELKNKVISILENPSMGAVTAQDFLGAFQERLKRFQMNLAPPE